MRYGFINNFSQLLAADLAIGATTMTLDGGGALLSAASADLVYTLTLDDGEGTTEIVHVTGQTTNDLTIVRAQEGTTAQAWPTGSAVEMRVTAGVMGAASIGARLGEFPLFAGPFPGEHTNLDQYFATGYDDEFSGTIIAARSIDFRIFNAAASDLDAPILIGGYQRVYNDNGYGAIQIGQGILAKPGGKDYILIGTQAGFGGGTESVGNTEVVAIGAYASAPSNYTVTVGAYAASSGAYTTSLGHSAGAYGDYCTIAGAGAQTFSDYTALIGASSQALAAFASAVGFGAVAGEPGTFVSSGMSVVPNQTREAAFDANSAPGTCMRSAQQVVLRSDTLDLSAANAFELTLPAGVAVFVDEVDVVAMGAVSGTPAVIVGTTAAGVDVLPSTTLTVAAANDRQKVTSATDAGVTGSLFFTVSTTGTGSVRIVVKGYALQG